jgi:hypothetical protein
MVNYQDSKIFKIVCNITGRQYIGSTTQPSLARRLAKLKDGYTKYLRTTGGLISREFRSSALYIIFESNDYDIVLIENFPCHSKDELIQRERYHIDKNVCVNKDYIEPYSKVICECGGSYRHYRKSKSAHYKTLKHESYVNKLHQ